MTPEQKLEQEYEQAKKIAVETLRTWDSLKLNPSIYLAALSMMLWGLCDMYAKKEIHEEIVDEVAQLTKSYITTPTTERLQ